MSGKAREKGGLYIRFDGPPGHEGGRFVEVERDGHSVNFGDWKQDGTDWLLCIPEPELDQFAMAALPAVIEAMRLDNDHDELAKIAYSIAESMMKARAHALQGGAK